MTGRTMRRLRGAAPATVCAVLAAVLAAATLSALASGCGAGGEAPAGAPPPASTAGEVDVWFADDQGALRTEARPVPRGADPLDVAMGELARGPEDPSLIPALPPGTRVLSTAVDARLATVDLSAELESGYPAGGSAAELAVVGPIVRTAAGASGADAVRILVEGRPPMPVGAQLDLSQPLSPGDLPAP